MKSILENNIFVCHFFSREDMFKSILEKLKNAAPLLCFDICVDEVWFMEEDNRLVMLPTYRINRHGPLSSSASLIIVSGNNFERLEQDANEWIEKYIQEERELEEERVSRQLFDIPF